MNTIIFQFGTFLRVSLSDFRSISTLGSSSSSNSFSVLFIRPFYGVLSVPIFYSKSVLLSLHSVVSLSSCILHQHIGRIFFFILKYPVLFVLLYPFSISFKPPTFSPLCSDLSLQVLLSHLSAVLSRSFSANICLRVFPSLALSRVVAISLHSPNFQ